MAQMVKDLPIMQETLVPTLSRKDPMEKGMTTYSSILAWRIPWKEEPGGLQSMGSQRVGHDWVTNNNNNTLTLFCVTLYISKILNHQTSSILTYWNENNLSYLKEMSIHSKNSIFIKKISHSLISKFTKISSWIKVVKHITDGTISFRVIQK